MSHCGTWTALAHKHAWKKQMKIINPAKFVTFLHLNTTLCFLNPFYMNNCTKIFRFAIVMILQNPSVPFNIFFCVRKLSPPKNVFILIDK